MTSKELKNNYINFFKNYGHEEILSSSLLPEIETTVLFTTSGMHPLIPYLLGKKHPLGNRLVNVQKCLRTGDIDCVGDSSHLTFFEMLGNWSLGDYFKEESIFMSFEFLTKVLNITKEKLYVTVFEGDCNFPKDIETYNIWKDRGLLDNQIFFYGKEHNWWGPVNNIGPCGPDTEIFYDTEKEKCCEDCGPSCNCGKYIEIWNNVFMEYNKELDGSYTKLKKHNVDTGMGLERILTIVNNKNNVYETELFEPIIKKIEQITKLSYKDHEQIFRIISDHVRSFTFILGDLKSIKPSNSGQGYVLRRLIRRSIRLLKELNINDNVLKIMSEEVINIYGDTYKELIENKDHIFMQLDKEYNVFSRTLTKGIKILNKHIENLSKGDFINSDLSFKLYETYGFPIEITSEILKEKGILVSLEDFKKEFKKHQEKSKNKL